MEPSSNKRSFRTRVFDILPLWPKGYVSFVAADKNRLHVLDAVASVCRITDVADSNLRMPVFLQVAGQHCGYHPQALVGDEVLVIFLIDDTGALLTAMLQCKQRVEQVFGDIHFVPGKNTGYAAIMAQPFLEDESHCYISFQ